MLKSTLNYEIKAGKQRLSVIENVATKIGGLFGERGRELGRAIDDMTKDVIIEEDILSYTLKSGCAGK